MKNNLYLIDGHELETRFVFAEDAWKAICKWQDQMSEETGEHQQTFEPTRVELIACPQDIIQ